jgi:Protein of unknown function DUF262.
MFEVDPHKSKSLRWWYHQRDEIDFEPPYQRKGNAWSKYAKSFLIDSIINGYDIPKIYLADFRVVNTDLNTKNLPYAIIDGRQRFEAIFEFFDNTLSLNHDIVFEKNPKIKLGGLTYDQIKDTHPDIMTIIDEYNLSIMSVITKDEERIQELFVRLNKSTPLTGAEVRNAMPGVVPEAIRRLTCHLFFADRISFNKKRGSDKNAAAKLLLLESSPDIVSTKKSDLDRMVDIWTINPPYDIEYIETKATKTLDVMSCIFSSRDTLLKKESVVPLYYLFVKYTGGTYKDDIRGFIEHFENMRKSARKTNYNDDNKSLLLEYSLQERTSNDATSIKSRLNILLRLYGYDPIA